MMAMPLFLLRDGAIRRFRVVPEGLELAPYQDALQRRVHVVLDSSSERRLLEAQPPVQRTSRRVQGASRLGAQAA